MALSQVRGERVRNGVVVDVRVSALWQPESAGFAGGSEHEAPRGVAWKDVLMPVRYPDEFSHQSRGDSWFE